MPQTTVSALNHTSSSLTNIALNPFTIWLKITQLKFLCNSPSKCFTPCCLGKKSFPIPGKILGTDLKCKGKVYKPCSRICKPRVQILFPQLTLDVLYTKLPKNLGWKKFSTLLLFDSLQAQRLSTTQGTPTIVVYWWSPNSLPLLLCFTVSKSQLLRKKTTSLYTSDCRLSPVSGCHL